MKEDDYVMNDPRKEKEFYYIAKEILHSAGEKTGSTYITAKDKDEYKFQFGFDEDNVVDTNVGNIRELIDFNKIYLSASEFKLVKSIISFI